MIGSGAVAALHRVFGVGLLALVSFWMLMIVTTDVGRSNFREALPTPGDVKAFFQDLQFLLGTVDERHPNARQFAGGTADEIPLLSYVGKGVVSITAVELLLLSVSGLLIRSKTGLMQYFATQTAAIAFVVFHGLLGVIIGIVSVLLASIYDTGYPVSLELLAGGGQTNLLLTVGVNIGMLVLFFGMLLSVYGNLVRVRWEQQMAEEAAADNVETEAAD